MRSIIPGLLYLSVLVIADPQPLPNDFHRFAPRQSGIQWQPCRNYTISTIECGRFEVPLDYTNEAAGKASLFVARYPATKQPKLGTLFFNPGGPGWSAVDMLLRAGETLMSTVTGQYDIVGDSICCVLGWDPRGVGDSHPSVSCFATAAEESTFWESTIVTGLEVRGNFTDPTDLQAFYDQVPAVDTLLDEYGKKCMEYSPNTLQYVGTTATVRDMVALHDYLESSDKPLNYWGLSYGTIIGIYFVNMFPSRVGRVVLDGVMDPVYWANRPTHEIGALLAESTEEALTGFVKACAAAGPTGCAIAPTGSTPESLREDLRQLINMAYDYKKSAGASAQFDSADIRDLLYNGMSIPTAWPELAEKLLVHRNFLTHNNTSSSTRRSFYSLHERQTNTSTLSTSSANIAITCADGLDARNTTTRDVFDDLVRVTRDVSPIFGPHWNTGYYCHRWPVRAVERYTGPWSNKLANPILVIGSEADPVAPFISAKSVADGLGDSAIFVEQDDYGHLSLTMNSDCTLKIVENYFLNNQLPSTDQFCGTNQQLFPGPGVTKSSLIVLPPTFNNEIKDLQSQLKNEQSRAHQLFIAVITLACATGLLLIWSAWSYIFGSKRGGSKKDTAYWGNDEESEQGHIYKTPFDEVTPLKLGGGYAPVKT